MYLGNNCSYAKVAGRSVMMAPILISSFRNFNSDVAENANARAKHLEPPCSGLAWSKYMGLHFSVPPYFLFRDKTNKVLIVHLMESKTKTPTTSTRAISEQAKIASDATFMYMYCA